MSLGKPEFDVKSGRGLRKCGGQAAVTSWDDHGLPLLFKDENGCVWISISSLGFQEPVAVECCGEDVAGWFWSSGDGMGTIARVPEGATFGTGLTGKYVAKGGEWTECG